MAVQKKKKVNQKNTSPKPRQKPQTKVIKPVEDDEDESEDDKDEKQFKNKQTDEDLNEQDAESDDDDDDDDDDESESDDDDDESDEENDSEESEEESKKGKSFSDENASWLKLKDKNSKKTNLLDSDEDDDEDDDDDDDEELEIEKESRLLDEEQEEEEREAEEEMQRTVREETAVYHLPTHEELERDVDRVVPTSETRSHIESILEVLADFKTRREPGRARKEYMDCLSRFLAELYGFLPELVDYFLTMFGPAECLEFIDASIKPRPLVIRTNTLKARRKDLASALIKRGVSLDPLASWSKVGLKIIESPVPIGATPEYLGGWYMLQSAASMCPVLALDPQPKERVMDMAAAPGGKTSYIAQLMRNTGTIMANDLKKERQKATVANLHRLGVKNVIACTHDGRKLGTMFHNRFDRILLDAPCSGLGVISRDASVKVQRTVADVNQTAHLQKELLLAAIDALKCKNTTAGIMVYSTCSVSIAENEAVVQYALNKRDICLLDTGLDFGKPGFTRYQERRFHPTMELTRRLYPHVHNMDGFFVAKIKKLSDRRPEDTLDAAETKDQEAEGIPAEEEGSKNKPSEDRRKNKRQKGKGDGKGKKRKTGEDKNDVGENQGRPSKRRDISIPPKEKMSTTKQKAMTKKKKTNAKVTKPRRSKPSTEV